MNKVYDIVVERILEEMGKGVVPWMRPWFGSEAGPSSYTTGKPYSVLNQILLRNPGMYITLNQVKKMGGRLKKGAKSQQVVFWKLHKLKETTKAGVEVEKTVPVLRYYNVFHTDLCEGLPEKQTIALVGKDASIPALEDVKKRYLSREGISVLENLQRACYSPGADTILMPFKTQFLSLDLYYHTFFHEIVHSTGHDSRLGRLRGLEPGWSTVDYTYNKEELVAELGAAFLLHRFGCETERGLENAASYIRSWSRVFENDPRVIVQAAAQAERAVRFILNSSEVYSEWLN